MGFAVRNKTPQVKAVVDPVIVSNIVKTDRPNPISVFVDFTGGANNKPPTGGAFDTANAGSLYLAGPSRDAAAVDIGQAELWVNVGQDQGYGAGNWALWLRVPIGSSGGAQGGEGGGSGGGGD